MIYSKPYLNLFIDIRCVKQLIKTNSAADVDMDVKHSKTIGLSKSELQHINFETKSDQHYVKQPTEWIF